MKLSVIIPCFNEAQHITQVLDAVKQVNIPKEIIVIDDGSSDGTSKVLEEYNRDGELVIHSSILNFGKGTGQTAGISILDQ